jgi:serine/threonine protein kinase
MGMSSYGEVSMADMLGGATFNILGKLGTDVLRPISEYMAAESGDSSRPIRSEALIRLATNVSTLSNVYKAYLVHQYGVLRANTGSTQVTDLPSEVAFATALGINPAEMDRAEAIRNFRSKRSDAVKELAKQFTNYRAAYASRPDQRETIMDEMNILARLSPPDILQEALERVQRETPDSYYAGLVEYYEQYQLETEANGETD